MARFRTWVGIAVAGALGVSLAGCSSTGGKRAEDARKAASAQGRAAVDTPRWTFAMITHSGDGDTFWDIVQNGAEQAAVKDNIKFLYSHDDEAQQQAQLVDAAVDKGVDGIIVTLAKPDAMKAALARAEKAGIPVITVNSGSAESKAFGALTHIGQDETIAGEAVGEELNRRGRKRPSASSTNRATSATSSAARGQEDLRRHRAEPVRRGHRHVRRTGLHRRQAPGRPVRGRGRHPRRPLRRHRREGPAGRGQRGRDRHLRPQRQGGGLAQGRHPRLRRRPAAVPPGVRGRRPALAAQVQRRHARRRQARPHRTADHHRGPGRRTGAVRGAGTR